MSGFIFKAARLPVALLKRIWTYVLRVILWLRYADLRPSFSIKSHLTFPERVALFKLAIKSRVILEIGSYVGASAVCFGAATTASASKKILCIDTWNNDAMSESVRDTWKEFAANTHAFRPYIHPVRGFSDKVVDDVKAIVTNVDLLFIDGDHTYQGVKADWDAYKSMLRKHSIVVFHDFGWAEGVQRVVREEVQPLCAEQYSLPNMWWGTLSRAP